MIRLDGQFDCSLFELGTIRWGFVFAHGRDLTSLDHTRLPNCPLQCSHFKGLQGSGSQLDRYRSILNESDESGNGLSILARAELGDYHDLSWQAFLIKRADRGRSPTGAEVEADEANRRQDNGKERR